METSARLTNSNNGQSNVTAVRIQVLYLLNLLLFPGIAFLLMLVMYVSNRGTENTLVRAHVSQAVLASVVVAALIIVFTVLMLLWGSHDSPYTWMSIILYFTCCHSVFILLGVYGLVKALSSQPVHYPVISRFAQHLPGYTGSG